jgi:hypothetical protein
MSANPETSATKLNTSLTLRVLMYYSSDNISTNEINTPSILTGSSRTLPDEVKYVLEWSML